ncbi:MAG: ribosome recycling factor [Oscillospiraceae bacterium]|jgi:ribosome recycling factor|nr:ribosome recycling factor [Oscillospiraceae bacterium]
MDVMKSRMQKGIDYFAGELATIRAGRANISVLDKIMVDYYGTPTPIQQMAAVSVAEARILVIQPWDKSTFGPIEKAIQKSDLGINPTSDGNVIRIAFPQPTEERRRELCKDVRKMAEEAKVAIRGIRRDGVEKAKAQKKGSEITEDDLKNLEKDIQNLTDQNIKEIDRIAAAKEKEILEI